MSKYIKVIKSMMLKMVLMAMLFAYILVEWN